MENQEEKTTDRIAREATRYINLKIDGIKLDLVENLSIAFSNGFGIVIFIVLAGIGLLLFAAVLTYLLSLLIGSMVWALVIMGVAFILAAVLTLMRRQQLFTNMMVRMFSRMFFKSKEMSDEEEQP